jgi:hypothetical protein
MEQFVEGRSPYEIMGIERGATAQEVKKVRCCCRAAAAVSWRCRCCS